MAFVTPNHWLIFNRAGLRWTDTPVRPGGVPLDSPVFWLVMMGGLGLLTAVTRGRDGARPSWTVLPAVGLSGMALASAGLLIGSFTLAPFSSHNAFSLARFSYFSATGSGCGLLDAVEALPVARDGILRRSGEPVQSVSRTPGITSAERSQEPYMWTRSSNTTGGAAQTKPYTSPWFTMPDLGRHQVMSVWVAGRSQQGTKLTLQFAKTGRLLGTRVMRDPTPASNPYVDPGHERPGEGQQFREGWLLTLPAEAVPSHARQVRVRAVGTTTDQQDLLAVSGPSVRDSVPLREFLRDTHPLYFDWRFAFLAPCRSDYPRVGHGTAQSVTASIEETGAYGIPRDPVTGGTFYGDTQFSTRTEIPTRVIGSPGFAWGHLYLHSYQIQKDAYDVTTHRVQLSGLHGQGPYDFDR
jgi:hypothetical protein